MPKKYMEYELQMYNTHQKGEWVTLASSDVFTNDDDSEKTLLEFTGNWNISYTPLHEEVVRLVKITTELIDGDSSHSFFKE